MFVLMLWIFRRTVGNKRHQSSSDGQNSEDQGSMKCESNPISEKGAITDGLSSLTGNRDQEQLSHHQQLESGYSDRTREEQPAAHLAIYLDSTAHNGIELQDQLVGTQLFGGNKSATTTDKVRGHLTAAAEPTVISNNPYDFLIVDRQHHHHLPWLDSQAAEAGASSTRNHQQATALLLLDTDSPSSGGCTCTLHHTHRSHCRCREKEPSAFAHTQLMTPPNDRPGSAISRHHCEDNPGHKQRRDMSYGRSQANECTNIRSGRVGVTSCSGISSSNHQHSFASGQYFDVQASDIRSSYVVRSPAGLLPLAARSQAASPASGGCNFELNSQGELTVTDESSSFIHDGGSGNSSDHQYVMCHACRLLENLNHLDKQQPGSSAQASQSFIQPCSDCHHLNHDLNHLNFDGATYVLSPPQYSTSTCPTRSCSPPTTSSQSSTLQPSTLKRKGPASSSSSVNRSSTSVKPPMSTDRVKLVNFDPKLNL